MPVVQPQHTMYDITDSDTYMPVVQPQHTMYDITDSDICL